MIHELLQKLGLSNKEIEVYSALFEQGKTTPARLSKATNINRSTVYAVLEQLKEKGLIIEDTTSKIKYVSLASSENVEEMFQSQQEQLKEKKKIAAQLAEELEKMPQSKTYSIPKIRFVEENDVEEFLYKQMNKWNESANDKTCWGFQDKSFAKNFPNWIKWAAEKYRMKIHLLSNESDIEEKLKKEYANERGTRFWGEQMEFTSSTWIMGNYLVMIVTHQHPFYLVEINDGVLAHNMREVFKKIWKEVKK